MTDNLNPIFAGKCPDCMGEVFRLGPRGGMNRNVECMGCRARFNVAVVSGKVVYADRIGLNGSWIMYRKTGPLSDAEVTQ